MYSLPRQADRRGGVGGRKSQNGTADRRDDSESARATARGQRRRTCDLAGEGGSRGSGRGPSQGTRGSSDFARSGDCFCEFSRPFPTAIWPRLYGLSRISSAYVQLTASKLKEKSHAHLENGLPRPSTPRSRDSLDTPGEKRSRLSTGSSIDEEKKLRGFQHIIQELSAENAEMKAKLEALGEETSLLKEVSKSPSCIIPRSSTETRSVPRPG